MFTREYLFCAGDPAYVALSARDAFLNPILTGEAKLVAQLRTYHDAEAAFAAVPAEVRDRGNGVYEIDCALKVACDFEVCSLPRTPWHAAFSMNIAIDS